MKKRHQRRIARNLLVMALLLLALWWAKGFPLPPEAALHRAERQCLTAESQVIWRYRGGQFSGTSMLVGTSPRYISTYSPVPDRLILWPRAVTAPTLVILPEPIRYTPAAGHSDLAPAFLAVDPPPLAESAHLTVDLRQLTEWPREIPPYELSGQKTSGGFLFLLEYRYFNSSSADLFDPEDVAFSSLYSLPSPSDFRYLPYTLTFFAADGTEIARYTNPQ